MNPDPEHNRCDLPEHGPSKEEDEYLIQNSYNAGSIVWAHVAGYPWWPAMVDDCPDYETYYWLEGSLIPTWYHVVFFDEQVSRAWLKKDAVAPFIGHENDIRYKQTKMYGTDYKRRLAIAEKQAADATLLSTIEKLKTYSFVVRYKQPLQVETKGKAFKTVKTVSTKATGRKHQLKGKEKIKQRDICKTQEKEIKTHTANNKKINSAFGILKQKPMKRKNKNDKPAEEIHPALGSSKHTKALENRDNILQGNIENGSQEMIFNDQTLNYNSSPKFISKKIKKPSKEATVKIETSSRSEVSDLSDEEMKKDFINGKKYLAELLNNINTVRNNEIKATDSEENIFCQNTEGSEVETSCEIQSPNVCSTQESTCEIRDSYENLITSTSQEVSVISLSQESAPFDSDE